MDNKLMATQDQLYDLYTRLNRKIESAYSHTYDKHELRDLSHILRMWMEVADLISEDIFPKINNVRFSSYSFRKEVYRALKGNDFISVYFPNNVSFFANDKRASEVNCQSKYFEESGLFIGWWISYENDKEFRLEYFIASKNKNKVRSLKNDALRKRVENKCLFRNWINTPFLSIKIKDFTGSTTKTLTIKQIIKRLANSFDGSHPSIDDEKGNEDDHLIEVLQDITVNQINLPYFILLTIAIQIEANMKEILNIQE